MQLSVGYQYQAVKQTSEGGYVHEFIDTPLDMFFCNICHLVSQNPYETNCCHHIFCKSCIDGAHRYGYRECPMCRQQTTPVQSILLDRQIKRFHVFCINKNMGCDWKGELQLINSHLLECPCIPGPCQYSIVGCKDKVTPDLQMKHNNEKCKDHLQLVSLKVAELKKTTATLDTTKQALQKSERDRANATTELLSAKQKLSNAEKTIAQTKTKTTQKIAIIEKELSDTKNSCAAKKSFLQKIKTYAETSKSSDVAIWSIKLILSEEIQPECLVLPAIVSKSQVGIKAGDSWYSQPFYTEEKGYKMCLQVVCSGDADGRGTHMSVSLCLMKGPYDDQLTWPLQKKFDITLLNQISNSEHHTVTVAYDNSVDDKIAGRVTVGERARGRQCSKFISHVDLAKVNSTRCLLSNHHLYFQVKEHSLTAGDMLIIFVVLAIIVGIVFVVCKSLIIVFIGTSSHV